MFRNAKVGDRVWSIQAGWGEITKINNNVHVQNLSDGSLFLYTFDGKYREEDVFPSLFWDKLKLEDLPCKTIKRPLPDLKVDTKVLVWNNVGTKKYRRYFSHFTKEGRIATFINGATSWSYTEYTYKEGTPTCTWEYYELVDD